ncbi:MAG: hypothetical protein E7207_00085 [Clostridium butyricum]|nr:hypothetical protein [Clostridium butyricum]
MNRFFKFVLASIMIVVLAFFVFKLSNQYRMNTIKNNISWNIYAKNCKDAVGFDKDQEHTYIAYKTYIKSLKNDGREDIILENEDYNIENILYYNEKLFFITKDKLVEYDLDKKNFSIILENIPSEGKYISRNLMIKDSKLLLSIGAVTNSGIADKDGYDINKVPYDKSPINITLNGLNFGKDKTGAFVPYGNSTKEGDKIKAQILGNASIVEIDLENNNNVSLYACGIRNVTGWDTDSENNLVGIVGGMENVGERPVERDSDYIYKIDKGTWYGWPDFSGGDPISSPKFKGEKIIQPLIANPPNKIVCAPWYVFDETGIVKYLALDKEGKVLDKDTMVFYNGKNNMIEALSPNKINYQLLKMKEESVVSGIKYFNNDIYILDSGIGCIYKLHLNTMNFKFNLPKSVWIFLILLGISLLMIIIIKENNKIKVKRQNKDQ